MIISHSGKFVFVHAPKCAGESVEYLLGPKLPLRDIIVGPQPNRLRGWNTLTKRITGLQKHSSAEEIRSYMGTLRYDEYFKFSIIRHPETRLLSYYKYLISLIQRKTEFPWIIARQGVDLDSNWDAQRLAFFEECQVDEKTFSGTLDGGSCKILSKDPFKWGGVRCLLASPDFDSFARMKFLENDPRFQSLTGLLCDRDGGLLVDEVIRFEALEDEWGRVGRRLGVEGSLPRKNAARGGVSAEMTEQARRAIRSTFQDDYALFGYC